MTHFTVKSSSEILDVTNDVKEKYNKGEKKKK